MSESGFVIKREAWMQKAKCKGEDTGKFVLDKGHSAREAKKICWHCPVRQACLEFGLRTGSVGVWGGHVLTFSSDETTEVYPVQPLQDYKPQFERTSVGLPIARPIKVFQQLPTVFRKKV